MSKKTPEQNASIIAPQLSAANRNLVYSPYSESGVAMELAIRTLRIEPDFVVVQLSGSLTIGEAERIESLVSVLLHYGERKLILELSQIERIDSVGGMALARCFFSAREAGGVLCVASAGECIVRFFKNTNIDRLISFHSTVEGACESFRAESS